MYSKELSYLKISFFSWMLFTIFCTILVITFNDRNNIDSFVSLRTESNFSLLDDGFLIKTNACKIPNLPIFSKELEKYMNNPDDYEAPKCENYPPLIESSATKLHFNHDSFDNYEISNPDLLNCCYQELLRLEPKQNEIDNRYELSKKCTNFTDATIVKKEFIHVQCSYKNNVIYKDMFSFVPIKYDLNVIDNSKAKINVLIIGLDGVSRLNFHRQMPKTSEYLKSASFVEFLGYNKVGDNTFPNVIPVLTGKYEDEILNNCYNKTFFDKCPFIWKSFKKNDYVTSFGEDTSWMGIFNYVRNGFKKQPTDYYWTIFNRVSEGLYGNAKKINVKRCIGPREQYKMLLDYIKNFVMRLSSYNIPYFSFFWGAALTHDLFNAARQGDDYYLQFFKELNDNGYFENTVVIFMSDHGIRYGPIRSTYQGRLEERLPFLFIRPPSIFSSKLNWALQNLISNTKKLTTPFDLHETLRDILKIEYLNNNMKNSNNSLGISLFKKIPTQRTCQDAGISAHWCTCQEITKVEINAEINKYAEFAVSYVNEMLHGYAACATLKLNKTVNAQKLHHKGDISEGSGLFEDYLISFMTVPGGGAFEATIRNYSDKKREVIGSVSRLNFYGDQSKCMLDFHLKLYCYCV